MCGSTTIQNKTHCCPSLPTLSIFYIVNSDASSSTVKRGIYFSVCGERATKFSHCGHFLSCSFLNMELKKCPQKKHHNHPPCLNTDYSNDHISRIVITQTCLLYRASSEMKNCTVMGIRQGRNILRNANSKRK